MKKNEFLKELENALEDKLPESDIKEITSDYGDIFDNGNANGKSDDDIAAEIGSPAKIARTILEDGINIGAERKNFDKSSNSQREYTNFQKNINEKTSKIFDKVTEPDRSVEIDKLTPMSRRLGAYVIDGAVLGIIGLGLILILFLPLYINCSSFSIDSEIPFHMFGMGAYNGMMGFENVAASFAFGKILTLVLMLGIFNLFTAIFLWATNGYTPGKWILKMRVVKINGDKLSFLDAFLRDVAIKCIANSITSGVLNLISFVWGCVTDDHKTVHDLVAQTRVVNVDKSKNETA